MVADGRTKKVRPLVLHRGGLIHPRCHPDLSLILRITARPAAAYLPMTRGVQPRGSGAMFPRVPGRIPPSAALLTHPARYSFHQSHYGYYTQWAEGLSRENAALPPLFLLRKKMARRPLADIIISIHWFQPFAVGRLEIENRRHARRFSRDFAKQNRFLTRREAVRPTKQYNVYIVLL